MDQERNADGSVTLRHAAKDDVFRATQRDWDVDQQVTAHVERNLGSVDLVFHEVASNGVVIDVLSVAPTAERPVRTLVTCGMSALPMTIPPGADTPARAELMLVLPAEWP